MTIHIWYKNWEGQVFSLAAGDTSGAGNWVTQYAFQAGLKSQRWIVKDVGGGKYSLLTKLNNLCVEIAGENMNVGGPCRIMDYTGGDHQKFTFESIGPDPNELVSIRGYIKDATTAALIPSADLKLNNLVIRYKGGPNNSITTSATLLDGSIYEVKLPRGDYQRTISIDKYSDYSDSVKVINTTDETISTNTVLLSPIVDGWRAVLTWNESPKDLDAYAKLPSGKIIFYNDRSSDNREVTLDTDARVGFGPETITFNQISNGIYAF